MRVVTSSSARILGAVADSGIPSEVERFLTTHIKSVEQLEVLLLLSSAPEKDWSVAAVYQVIKSSESSVRDRLDELVSQGLLQRAATGPLTYRFAPTEKATSPLVAELATAYKERRVRIVQLIYSPPTSAAEEFANAFKLRRDK